MAHVTASFAISAGGWAEGEIDTDGLTGYEIAERIWDKLDPEVSVCHQCAHRISDPEADELTGFSVDGVHYELRDGHWVTGERELWTTRQAAEHCGVAPATYRDYTRRLGAPAPINPHRGGPDGTHRYDADAVRAWHANRPGRGWHGPHLSEPRQKETESGQHHARAGGTGAR